MQFSALIFNAIFASVFINLCFVQLIEATSCDISWIRFMYMLSCGRKKRENVPIENENFSESIPIDIYDAIEYYKEKDPYNPLFNEDNYLLNDILDEDERLFRREMVKYGRIIPKAVNWKHWKKMEERQLKESSFLNQIFSGNRLGIQGFPEQWDINELREQKANKNYRRQIDHLLEQCCRTDQDNTCNEETFLGAC